MLQTIETVKNTVATTASTVAQKALNGVMQVGSMIKGALLSPLTLITVGVTALIKVYDALTTSAEEQQEKIDELTELYEESLNRELMLLERLNELEKVTTLRMPSNN